MGFFSKKEENKYKIDKINLSPIQKNISKEVFNEEEELIWADGYKGFLVDNNGELRSKYNKGFIYSSKMNIEVDVKLNECNDGFHFCKELQKCFKMDGVGSHEVFSLVVVHKS